MKRFFVTTIMLIVGLVILTGCAEPLNPLGNSIKAEKGANDNLVSHIQISSGNKTISPFGLLLWAKYDNGDGTFDESYPCILDTPDIIDNFAEDIPTLPLNESVSYLVQVNGSVEKVNMFKPNGDGYIKSETTFDALSSLADGTYYVVFEVLLNGNCDPDAPQNSFRYEDVFRLVVE